MSVYTSSLTRQFMNVLFETVLFFLHATVTNRFMRRSIGLDLCAIQRDMAEFHEIGLLAQMSGSLAVSNLRLPGQADFVWLLLFDTYERLFWRSDVVVSKVFMLGVALYAAVPKPVFQDD